MSQKLPSDAKKKHIKKGEMKITLPVMIPPTMETASVTIKAITWYPACAPALRPTIAAVVFVPGTLIREGQMEYRLRGKDFLYILYKSLRQRILGHYLQTTIPLQG